MIQLNSTKPDCVWKIDYKELHTHVMEATEVHSYDALSRSFRDVVKGIDRVKAKQVSYEKLLDLLLGYQYITWKTWLNAPLEFT